METLRNKLHASLFKSEANKDIVKPIDQEELIILLDKDVLRPSTYLAANPGKNVRRTLINAINHWLEISEDKLNIITNVIMDFHAVSLLIDDIQDGSAIRRGAPAAHTIFGITNTACVPIAIVASNSVSILTLNHPKASEILIEASIKVLAGQGMELYYRDKVICPTEKEYLQMISRKTGEVLQLGNKLMQLFTTKKKDLDRLITAIGLFFQINDDYQNLNSQVYFDSKGFCDDITEGKFGFPVVHAINSHPKEGEMIIDILRERTTDVNVKKRCLSLIEACGSFEYTRNKIEELKTIIFEEIDKLGGNPHIDEFFIKLVGSMNVI